MPGVLTNGMMAPRIGSTGPGEGPPPSFLEGVGASINRTVDDVSAFQEVRLHKAYNELEDSLVSLGNDREKYRAPFWKRITGDGSDLYDKDAMWADIASARQRDPKAFGNLPADRAAFEQFVLNREGRSQKDAVTASRAGLPAQLTGGIIGGFADPMNLATLPIGGGGKTILQTAAREGVLNALVEATQQPILARNMERRGEELTLGQAAGNVAMAGVGGSVLGGTLHAAGSALPAVREAALAQIYPRLPESVRSRFGRIEDVPDSALADLLETTLGRDNLTPDEVSALHVMRREDEIAATNPFVRNGAGIQAHVDNMRAAMERILADVPASTPAPGMPALRSSTAISSGTVDMSARAMVKRRIGVAENATGSNTARPIGTDGKPLSTALGRYQFTEGTWGRLYRRRFGSQGLSDAQISAKRTDPQLQDVLMDDLMAANGAALRRAGQAETAGNIYLAHFAGADKAVRLLEADPSTPIRNILSPEALHANRFINGFADMTAGDLVRWAERKMGQEVPSPRAGERVEIAGGDPESGLQRQLQEQLDRLEGERQALEQGEARQPVIEPDDFEPVIADLGDDIPLPAMPRAKAVRTAPMDLFQFIASKGGIADNEGHNLKGMFDGNPFVPGIGTLVRERGMSLDRVREMAVEAGYFGDPNRTDFTVADLLDAMDRQRRGETRHFVPTDMAEVEARRQRIQQSADYDEFDQRLRNAAGDRGLDDLTDDDALRAYELWDGESFENTLDRVIAEHMSAARMEALAEFDPEVYAQLRQMEDEGYGARRPDDGSDPGYAGERQADAGNAGEMRTRPADGRETTGVSRSPDDAADSPEPPDLIPEAERIRWDEPDGQGAEWQAKSLDHDFRAALGGAVDPNIAARQRQEAQMAADAPLQGSAKTGQAQGGTMGLGLFDAADQPGFRLNEEGGTINPADLLAELDEEEAALQIIKGCL
ncbi:hypothetical protein [Sphingobium indicum]